MIKATNFQVFSTFYRVKGMPLNTKVLHSVQEAATNITRAQHITRRVSQSEKTKVPKNLGLSV